MNWPWSFLLSHRYTLWDSLVMPKLYHITWHCATMHLGSCLDNQTPTLVWKTHVDAKGHCNGYNKCCPHNTINRSNNVSILWSSLWFQSPTCASFTRLIPNGFHAYGKVISKSCSCSKQLSHMQFDALDCSSLWLSPFLSSLISLSAVFDQGVYGSNFLSWHAASLSFWCNLPWITLLTLLQIKAGGTSF